jgi:hypothetical protein
MQERQTAQQVVHGLDTKSAKIRALVQAGYDRGESPRFLVFQELKGLRRILL